MKTKLPSLLPKISLLCLLGVIWSATLAAESQSVCDRVRALLPKVASVRGLPAPQRLGCEELSVAELEKVKRQQYAQSDGSSMLSYEELAYRAIGLVPDSFAYERCLVKGILPDLLATYEPSKRAILIPAGRPASDALLAHEIVHALQDRYVHIGVREKKLKSTDQSLGFYGLLEGDAVRIQAIFEQPQRVEGAKAEVGALTQNTESGECHLPESIARNFDFPYSFGALFVDRIVKGENGAARLGELMQKPPQTSSQILHRLWNPQWGRYSDKPISVPRAWRLPAGQVVYSDSLGEYMTGVLLSATATISRAEAILTGRGWLSDRLEVLRSKDATQVRWRTDWQSLAAAEHFQRNFIGRLSENYNIELNQDAAGLVASTAAGRWIGLGRRAESVLFIATNHSSTAYRK